MGRRVSEGGKRSIHRPMKRSYRKEIFLFPTISRRGEKLPVARKFAQSSGWGERENGYTLSDREEKKKKEDRIRDYHPSMLRGRGENKKTATYRTSTAARRGEKGG